MTYVPVTVGRQADGFTVGRSSRPPVTVGRGTTVTFTVGGHPGSTGFDGALTTENGFALLLESGGILLLDSGATVTVVDTGDGLLTLSGAGVSEADGIITLTGPGITETNGIVTIA